MAKRKNKTVESCYYVAYDKSTGELLAVGCGNNNYENYFEVPFEQAEPFISGEYKFHDYLVGNKRQSNGKIAFTITQKVDEGYAFKNNLFEWIREKKTKTDCTVEWNQPDQAWYFSLDPAYKLVMHDNLVIQKLVFFVMLETDFDFLIRTIILEAQQLVQHDRIKIPFESRLEKQIDKISISSKLVFKSYKLKVVYD